MGFIEINRWSRRYNPGRINALVAHVIVVLDMIHVNRLGHTRYLVEIFQVIPDIGVIDNTPQVALEVAHINGIEAHQGGE